MILASYYNTMKNCPNFSKACIRTYTWVIRFLSTQFLEKAFNSRYPTGMTKKTLSTKFLFRTIFFFLSSHFVWVSSENKATDGKCYSQTSDLLKCCVISLNRHKILPRISPIFLFMFSTYFWGFFFFKCQIISQKR